VRCEVRSQGRARCFARPCRYRKVTAIAVGHKPGYVLFLNEEVRVEMRAIALHEKLFKIRFPSDRLVQCRAIADAVLPLPDRFRSSNIFCGEDPPNNNQFSRR
jgi:hypothetical protein